MSERRAAAFSWHFRLPLPLLLALRYLKSSRRDAYVSFLSLLAAGGIALGVGALILVLAGLSGLQDFLRRDVLARTPHLEIELAAASDAEAALATLDRLPEVVGARRLLRGRGWLRVASRVVEVEIIGYEGRLPRFFPGASHDQEGLYLSETLALGWGLETGDLVDVISPRPTLTPFGPQPRIHQQRLVGTFRPGRTEEEGQRLAMPLAVAQKLLGDRQTRLEVETASLEEALEVAERVAAQLPAGSRVRTWKDLNHALFFALRLEKALMFVSVFLIVPVAALALVTVLALLISSKRGEIGILQAMGATPREVRRTFLILGGVLGLLGLTLGGSLGIAGAWLFDRYRLISPPGDVYFIDHIPFRIEGGDVLAVVLCTLLLTGLSTVYAARRAAAQPAVEVLRG